MRTALHKVLLMPFAMPLLVAAVLSLALIGEVTYQSARATLTGGIQLTDARMDGTKLLQLITDAEAAQRSFLLTGNSAYLQRLREAQQSLSDNNYYLERIGSLSENGPQTAEEIRMTVNAKFAEINRTLDLAREGNISKAIEVVQSDAGTRHMDELRGMLQTKLGVAAAKQQDARESIYASLLFNRLAIFALSCVLALGLYLHAFQSSTLDRERANYQQTLENEVAEKSQGIKTLAAWLETAREEEKSHLARELHDELGGILTAAKLTLMRIRGKLSHDAQGVELIDSLGAHLNEGIALKRRIIEDLRPTTLNIQGFHVALENLCEQTQRQLGVKVAASISEIHLTPEVELAMFRVAQEALVNVSKYAKATQISVLLEKNSEGILLRITDNGVGFDMSRQQPGRHGLAGMQFRMESQGGTLAIRAKPNHGVAIEAHVPLPLSSSKVSLAA